MSHTFYWGNRHIQQYYTTSTSVFVYACMLFSATVCIIVIIIIIIIVVVVVDTLLLRDLQLVNDSRIDLVNELFILLCYLFSVYEVFKFNLIN